MKNQKLSVRPTKSGGTRTRKHGEGGSKETMDKREQLANRYSDDLLFADGYDDAIIGVAIGFDASRVIYDVQKMIESCMKNSNISYDEAAEWLDYNTFGAYVGPDTPIYMEGCEDVDGNY